MSQEKKLKVRALSASKWVFSGYVASQVIRLAGNLILTRLLVPEMFGVMAIVSVFMMGMAMFSDLGITQNIIQSERGEDKVYLNTAWTLQIIRGAVITIFALLFSMVIFYLGQGGLLNEGSVYGDRRLPLVLAVASLSSLVSGFNSINLTVLNRKLKLSKITIIEVVSQSLGLVLMIILAWYQRDIWALVFGAIVSAIFKMIFSHHSLLGARCRLCWDKEAVSEIFNFGKWIFGASIFTFLLAQGDRLILGWLVTPEKLGIYTVAFFLATALKMVLKKVISSVFYPTLCDVVRSRRKDLKGVYYKIRGRVDFLVMTIVGLMASTGHIVIDVLYDDRYQDAGWMLEILTFSLVFMGTSVAGVCLMALGNSKAVLNLTAIATVSLYICVPWAYQYYGLWGALVAITLNPFVEIPLMLYMMKKNDILCWQKEFRMWPMVIISYGCGRALVPFLESTMIN